MADADQSTQQHDKDDWSLLAASAQGGDQKAYNALLRDIVPFIKSVLAPGLANPDWVDDITQDVLISVHKSLKTYSKDRAFKPWLLAIINFRRTDFLRKHYRLKDNQQTRLENKDFISSHVTKPYGAGELKDIEAALDGLPQKQRELFTLVKIQGYTTKEVAEQKDMSVTAVKVSVHRTANKLKKLLK